MLKTIRVLTAAICFSGLVLLFVDVSGFAPENLAFLAKFQLVPAVLAGSLGADGTRKRPVVDAERCTGCGACEYVCPARPVSAVMVEGNMEHRMV